MSRCMGANNNIRGVLWMGGAVLSFSAMAIGVRELLARMEPFEVLFWRSALMLLIVLALLPHMGIAPLRAHRFSLHAWRNLFHFGGQYAWIYAIGALPLATVFAIEFTMPVWTAILASLFLKERFSFPRLVMLTCGLAGVLVILRPGAAPLAPAAFVMLAGALGYAANMIYTKKIVATDAPLAVLFWMPAMQAPIALAAAAPAWVWPVAIDLPWMALLGVGSYAAHYCMTRAMKLADATVVVPIDFARLPLIAVVGALFYGEPFDPIVLVGAAVIFAGTYYALSRERG
ncbi:MAG TPA: DMT family transporter [Burkholderiales bacterium]|nr:DMT family transporter [Burkholderiales bacterium]